MSPAVHIYHFPRRIADEKRLSPRYNSAFNAFLLYGTFVWLYTSVIIRLANFSDHMHVSCTGYLCGSASTSKSSGWSSSLWLAKPRSTLLTSAAWCQTGGRRLRSANIVSLSPALASGFWNALPPTFRQTDASFDCFKWFLYLSHNSHNIIIIIIIIRFRCLHYRDHC